MENLYGAQSSKASNSFSNTIWIIVVFIAVIAIGASLDSDDKADTPNQTIKGTKTTNFFSRPKTAVSIQSIKDIEEMRKAIDNTIWTHTKHGDLFWLKLEFKKDKVKIYKAFPSDGQWTFEEECSYFLEEGRFIDDGRRYIAAVIESKDMSIPPKFVITNGHLSWLGFIDAGGFVLGDYEWD